MTFEKGKCPPNMLAQQRLIWPSKYLFSLAKICFGLVKMDFYLAKIVFLQKFSKVHKIFAYVQYVFASEVPFTNLLTSRNTLANLKDNSDCQTQKRYIFKKFTLISFKFVISVIRYWCADTNLIYLKLYKITQFF